MALNNAEAAAHGLDPDLRRPRAGSAGSTAGAARARGPTRGSGSPVTVPPLSAVVYRAEQRLARNWRAPHHLARRRSSRRRERLEVGANVAGDGFNEVTFLAKGRRGGWQPIGTDDNRPYRVFHDVSGLEPGTPPAVPRGGARQRAATRAEPHPRTRVAAPAITLEAPAAGGKVRGTAEVRAVAAPDESHYVVTLRSAASPAGRGPRSAETPPRRRTSRSTTSRRSRPGRRCPTAPCSTTGAAR